MGRGRNERDHERAVAVGRRLTELREQAGLTQEELAERADVHRASVGFIERANREPGVTLLWRMADGLGITIDELLSGVEAAPRAKMRRSKPVS